MSALYRYHAVDLRTGAHLAYLPLHDVTFGRILNGAGPIKASLQLPPLSTPDNRQIAAAYVDATEETRRVIIIERLGVPLGAWAIWTTDYSTDTQTLELAGADLWSYWRRRRIRWTREYLSEDQLYIARNLVSTSQGATGGHVGLVIGHERCGIRRDRNYRAFEEKPVAEAVEQLAALDGGFDFSVDVTRTGDDYERRLNMHYPRQGRTADESGLVFTLGTNMLDLRLPRDGTRVANSFSAIGAGEGDRMLRSVQTSNSTIAAGYPLLEDSGSYKDVKEQRTIDDHAFAELRARRRPISLPTATVLAGVPELTDYGTGDEARLRVLPGRDPRWPNGLDLVARINSWTVTPPDDGQPETVRLVFEERAA